MSGLEEDTALVRALCAWADKSPSGVAKAAGLAVTTITRPFNGDATSRISMPTLEKLRATFPGFDWTRSTSDLPPPSDHLLAYVEVEVLPTYAGMGGGGTGDGDKSTALLSRRLIEDELGVRPADVLLINVRGNSMEPLFFHGDQLLIDRRDRSPTQPGPFALRHGDEYVVKNVRWVEKRTRFRVWSQNEAVGGEEFYDPDEVDILGRPVWFARRL